MAPTRTRKPRNVEFVEPTEQPKKSTRARKTAPPTAEQQKPKATRTRRPKTEAPKAPIAVTPAGMDPNKLMFAEKDTTEGPRLSVAQVARLFFDRTDHWLRLQENKGYFTFNGEPFEVGRSHANARIYLLADIEMIIHALAQNHRISGQNAVLALMALSAIGKIHGFLPSDD